MMESGHRRRIRANGHMMKQEKSGQGIRKSVFTLRTAKQGCAVFVLGLGPKWIKSWETCLTSELSLL